MSILSKNIKYFCALTKSKHFVEIQVTRKLSFWSQSKAPDWKKAVSEAEKVVGYPTSFMSLRCLLSDELSNVAMQMRKLVGTKHPLLKTARKFFLDGKHSMQTRGLLVLLISKASVPLEHECDELQDKMVSGIYQSQRSLAEITEMIYTASLIHKGVVNLSNLPISDGSVKDMELGNKMAVLSGDFLLANASTGLAELNNTEVVDIMSSAIGDLMEAEFTKLRDEDGNSRVPSDGVTVQDWETQTYLTEGSLIAKSCKSALVLAGQCSEAQNKAFEFGKQIALARQARDDIKLFLKTFEDNGSNGLLTSLPMILQLQKQPHLLADLSSTNSHDIMKFVVKDTLNESKDICKLHGHKALDAIQYFPTTEARTAIENIIRAVITT